VPCRYLVEQLNKYGLAYLHMVEGRVTGNDDKGITQDTLDPFRKVMQQLINSSGGACRPSVNEQSSGCDTILRMEASDSASGCSFPTGSV
jgi:12-oxophytodienoic acid reductase